MSSRHPNTTAEVALVVLFLGLIAGPGTYGYQSCTQGFPNKAKPCCTHIFDALNTAIVLLQW
jgi:hypothetical protein